MIEKRPNQNPEYSVLYNLKDERGLPMGDSVVVSMAFGDILDGKEPPTITYILIGQSGSGKSIIEGQLEKRAYELAGTKEVILEKTGKVINVRNLFIQSISFDYTVTKLIDDMKKEDRYVPREQWVDQWNEVSDRLYDHISVATTSCYPSEKYSLKPYEPGRKIVFASMSVLGPLNKGKTTVQKLMARPTQDVVTYGILTDPFNQLSALSSRDEIATAMDNEIIQVAKRRNLILHLKQNRHPRTIKERMSTTGSRGLIIQGNKDIDNQTDYIINQLAYSHPEEIELPDQVVKHLTDPKLLLPYRDNPLYSHLTADYLLNWYKRRLIQMRYTLYEELGAGDRGLILYNLHNPYMPIHWHGDVLEETMS